MIRVLLTAFEPFGGDKENASALVLQKIPERTEHYEAVKRILPVEFAAGPKALLEAMEETKADMVIALGQAGGRSTVTPEKVAINLMDGRIPDNSGFSPDEEALAEGGETAIFTNLPIKKAVAAGKEAGLPLSVSYTAGAYVCNAIFFTMMNRIRETAGESSRFGQFIHVPYLKEQKELPENMPTLSLEEVVKSVAFLVEYYAAYAEEQNS